MTRQPRATLACRPQGSRSGRWRPQACCATVDHARAIDGGRRLRRQRRGRLWRQRSRLVL